MALATGRHQLSNDGILVLGRGVEKEAGGSKVEVGGRTKEARGHQPKASSGSRVWTPQGVASNRRPLVRNSVERCSMLPPPSGAPALNGQDVSGELARLACSSGRMKLSNTRLGLAENCE